MKKLTRTILFPAVLLCSCSHYYYVANVQNVPLFREKNELRFSGTIGGGDESECIEIQTAYSLSNKVGIMANYMHAKGGDVSDYDYGKGNYFDGAIGYYKPIKEYGVFEIYGGLGRGSQHHQYGSGSSSDLSFTKLFIQPSFGMTFNFLDVAISTRICRLSYTDINNNTSGNTGYGEDLYALSDKSHFFLEPAITLRGGWKNIKVQLQFVYAIYLNSPQLYFGEEAHLSAGLSFAIAKRLKQ
jgi:hypothetical protein